MTNLPVRRLFLSVFLCAAPSLSAQSTPSAARSALADTLAREVVAHSPSISEMMQRLTTPGMPAQVDSQSPMAKRHAAAMKAMSEFFEKHLPRDTVQAVTRGYYAETFTESDLRALLAFYRTETGRKALRTAPEMMTRIQQRTSEIMMKHGEEMRAIMMKAMEGVAP